MHHGWDRCICVCNLQHIHIYMQLRRYMSIERWCKCKSNQFLYSIFVLAEGLTTAAKQTMDAPARWRSRIMLSSGYSMTQWPLTNMHDLILRRWHIEIEYIFYCASSVESHIETRSYIYIYISVCVHDLTECGRHRLGCGQGTSPILKRVYCAHCIVNGVHVYAIDKHKASLALAHQNHRTIIH